MRSLKTNLKKVFFLALVISITACKKDKANTQNYFEYAGIKYQITNAKQSTYNGNTRVVFSTAKPTDYLQIDFPKVNTLPIGSLIYNDNPNSVVYDPLINFSTVIFGAEGGDRMASGGNINITKPEDYHITFELQAEKGKITGTYDGTPNQN